MMIWSTGAYKYSEVKHGSATFPIRDWRWGRWGGPNRNQQQVKIKLVVSLLSPLRRSLFVGRGCVCLCRAWVVWFSCCEFRKRKMEADVPRSVQKIKKREVI